MAGNARCCNYDLAGIRTSVIDERYVQYEYAASYVVASSVSYSSSSLGQAEH